MRDLWPRRRSYHIATSLGYGEQHQTLLISGGDGDCEKYGDMWLLDLQSGIMENVRIVSIKFALLNLFDDHRTIKCINSLEFSRLILIKHIFYSNSSFYFVINKCTKSILYN